MKKSVSDRQPEASIEVQQTIAGITKKKRKRISIRPFLTEPAISICEVSDTFQDGKGWTKVAASVHIPCYREELQAVQELAEAMASESVQRMRSRNMDDSVDDIPFDL